MVLIYGIIAIILLALELLYFKVADHFNIIDKPNERSSHSTIVVRGGGVIFALSALVWSGLQASHGNWPAIAAHWTFLAGLILIAVISFIDDIVSLSVSARMVGQFIAATFALYNFGMLAALHTPGVTIPGIIVTLFIFLISLIIYVGAMNVINFMDGINGMTGAYCLAVLIPMYLINNHNQYILQSLIAVLIISVLVFCLFNFREKGRAKCFAGDVGSISIGFTLLFMTCEIVLKTHDLTYMIFLVVYGVDGVLTICHRILLHENLGVAHRKHLYQLLSNELHMSHILVSTIYAGLQIAISLGFIYLCPHNATCHWIYFIGTLLILSIIYILFKKKYYHLHEEYLANLKK